MKRTTHTAPPLAGHQAAGLWAVAARYPLASAVAGIAQQAAQGPPTANFNERLRSTGGFTSYINPDGDQVSCLEEDYSGKIKQGAIALIPLHGLMWKGAPDWYQLFDVVNTTRVENDVRMAAQDPRVAAIIIHANSPGGMVYGVEQLSLAVQQAAAVKPVTTYVDDLMASAAVFATAHSTSIVAGGNATEVGSIGTMTTLVNDDEYWAKYGVKWIDVYATASTEKNAAWREAREGDTTKLVAEQLDPLNAIFLATVKAGRGAKLQQDATGAPLNGRMYVGQAAVQVGLVDGMATLQHTIAQARATNPNTPMSKLSKLAGFVASLTGLFQDKSAPTAEEIAEANQSLATEGITGVKLVTTQQQEEAATQADMLQSASEQRDALQAEVERLTAELEQHVAQRTEMETTLQAAQNALAQATAAATTAAQECGLDVPEGASALNVVIAALKAKPGATHTGTSRQGDDKPDADTEAYPSLAAAKSAGIKV